MAKVLRGRAVGKEGRVEKQTCDMSGFILRAVGNNFQQENDMTGFVFSSDHPSFRVENQLKEDWGDWYYTARQRSCCSLEGGRRDHGRTNGQIWELLKNIKYTNFAIIRTLHVSMRGYWE